jgi:hypothetical protein
MGIVPGTDEMIDITSLMEGAASMLTYESPMLHTRSFSLQDSMAALELMDLKMDCCEINVSNPPSAVDPMTTTDERMAFPRPAPTGLDDEVDPLPWNDLTMEDAAFIAVENLVRLESLLNGASVVESIYTSLYAHKAVMEDMKNRLEVTTLTEQMQAIMRTTAQRGTTPQHVVYASTLMLIELTDLLRGIILNADIFEEEDFTVSAYNIAIFQDRDELTVMKVGHTVSEMVIQMQSSRSSPESQIVILILDFQLEFINLATSLARLAGKTVREEMEHAQKMARAAMVKLTEIRRIWMQLKSGESEHMRLLIRRTFDSYVNRPLVGNAPVRKIVFREAHESIEFLSKLVGELDWGVCNILLKANTLGRIRRMLGLVSDSSTNILTRSFMILNLYFDDQIFGQFSLPELIIGHVKEFTGATDETFKDTLGQTFLLRLCKPVYDTLKVLLLNRNGQRNYIDVMLSEWAGLRHEAYVADISHRPEIAESTTDVHPYFSLYVLNITIELMDKFVDLGVELQLFCNEHELAVAYWYRDFLTSSLLSQMNNMRLAKLDAKQTGPAEPPVPARTKSQQKAGKKKAKSKRSIPSGNGNNSSPSKGVFTSVTVSDSTSPEDREEDFEFLLLNLKRGLCRGLVRFFAAIRQAGLIQERKYEFTSNERIFEKRFEAFAGIQQPPPLSYEDYLKGSDFSKVSQKDLLSSTVDCFTMSKSMVDRLLTQIQLMDPNYLPIREHELNQLAKVCIGNSIYLQKLLQVIDSGGKPKPRVVVDLKTHNQFCTIKIT